MELFSVFSRFFILFISIIFVLNPSVSYAVGGPGDDAVAAGVVRDKPSDGAEAASYTVPGVVDEPPPPERPHDMPPSDCGDDDDFLDGDGDADVSEAPRRCGWFSCFTCCCPRLQVRH